MGVNVPVNMKIRLHESVETTIAIMKRLVNVGVAGFTVHGRYWWQKGDKLVPTDWNAIRTVREAFPQLCIVGNGSVECYDDIARMYDECKVDGVMIGYAALKNPRVFSPENEPTARMIERYITHAQQHKNNWIDILRHMAWMLKNEHLRGKKELKAQMFKTSSLAELQAYLLGLGIEANLPPRDDDQIVYPTRVEQMSAAQRKKFEARQKKMKRKQDQKDQRKRTRLEAEQPSAQPQ
jgi:tRNA-dihydrouridine synthase